jgi:hypothetical protein
MKDDVSFDIEDLPLDVFELSERGLLIESLTGGHALPENGASSCAAGMHSSECGCGGTGGGGSCLKWE